MNLFTRLEEESFEIFVSGEAGFSATAGFLHNNHRYHRRNHFYIASICFCLWNEIVIIIFIVVILIITRICNIWRFFIIILKNDRTKIAATAINAILISRQNSLSFSFGYFLLNPFFKLSQIINSKYNFIYFRENILFFWKILLKKNNQSYFKKWKLFGWTVKQPAYFPCLKTGSGKYSANSWFSCTNCRAALS